MSTTITGNNLEEFVQKVIDASQEGLIPSYNVKPTGYGVGLLGKMAQFDVVTKECGKIYVGRGLSGLVGIISELASEGRDIRSVTPVSIYKDRLEESGYVTTMLVKPIVAEVIEEDVDEGDAEKEDEGVSEESETVSGESGEEEGTGVESEDNVSEIEGEEDAPVDEPTDILPSDTELTQMKKSDILQLIKGKGLKGNIQMSKGVMIKRLKGE